MNSIIKKIIDSMTIEYGDTVIVGFSGGPDSLTLLHALNSVKTELGLSLFAVHINHKIRPVDCDLEAEHAKTLCDELAVPFKLVVCDCKKLAVREKISDEEAGRKVRYESFSGLARELEQRGVSKDRIKIAVAQNADDQVETVLFHILRGTAVRGLAGIPLRRLDKYGYEVIRPLLGVNRAEVESYICECNLSPNVDDSNEKPIYSRNKIRLELIPSIEREYNPSFRKAIKRLSESATCDDNFLMQEATKLYEDMIIRKHEYEAYKLRDAHEALKRRVSAIMLEAESVTPTYELVNSVVSIIDSDNPSASYDLPGGVTAERRYEKIVFLQKGYEKVDASEDYRSDGKELISRVITVSEYLDIQDNNTSSINSAEQHVAYAAFDLDKLIKAGGIVAGAVGESELISIPGVNLRTRRQGDYIETGNGSKKLQDFLVDEKVPRSCRDRIKIVAICSEILWILPYRMFKSERYRIKGKYSQNYQIDNSSERVLFLELR